MKKSLRNVSFGLLLSLNVGAGRLGAQGGVEADPNYMFAAVLGSGFYRVEDATLTVVRMPFAMTLREESEDEAGWRLLLPVTVGYASLDPEDPIDRWLPEKVGSLSFIPGIEYRRPLGDHWLVKPFAQLGGGFDFNNGILSGVVVGGARVLGTFQATEDWRVQLGSSVQWAAEWQESKGLASSFGLVELGADFSRDLPWCIGHRRMHGGFYGRWRHFLNDWNVADTPFDPIGVDDLFEIGVSVGVHEGFDLFGYDLRRVSLGWVTGKDVQAVTLGTTFPF